MSAEAGLLTVGEEGPGAEAGPERIAVLHLVHTVAFGGVETTVINWLLALDRRRFDVHLACFANPGGTEQPFVKAAESRGLRVLTIPWGRRKPLLRAARALAMLVRELGIDVLHTHNWYADFVGALARRLAPVRTVTTVYVWSDYDWRRNLLQAVDQYVIRTFDLVTAHCEDTYRKTLARGVPPRRLRVLISGFEATALPAPPGERRRRRRAAGVADDEVLLANVARLYPEKVHDSLLRIFQAVLERCPRARLFIAGVGPREAELKALSRRMGLEARVRFVGFVGDLPTFLSLVDVMVHPAAIEGVPQAIGAGMAAGLPIVASAVGGLPEILEHGKTGLLIPAGDEGAFAQAVLSLIQAPEERRRLGSAARRFLETSYSIGAAVKRVENAYRDVVAE